MRFLHTMLRVPNLDAALHFYVNLLGLEEVRRRVDDKNKFTLVFLAAPEDVAGARAALDAGRRDRLVELTFNWDTEDYGERASSAISPMRSMTSMRRLRKAAERLRHHQSAAARRQHGVRTSPDCIRSSFCRKASRTAQGTVGIDAEYRKW